MSALRGIATGPSSGFEPDGIPTPAEMRVAESPRVATGICDDDTQGVSQRQADIEWLCKLHPGYDPFETAGDCWLDHKAAADTIEFVESCCRHVKGELAGQLIILEDWEKALYANVFGWKRPDGTRRYREVLLYIPRKNAKTTIAATIVLLVLYTDQEPGGEAYSAAADREQARLCFEIATGMIRQEPILLEHAELFKYSIVVGSNSYKVRSSEVGTAHGLNPHLIVTDELHAHRSAELVEALMTGTGGRTQPLVVHMTTADYDREGSVCNAKHDYASKVRDGIIEDSAFLPVIYEATREDDWTDPKVWAKANPNLGISISRDYIAHECQRAKDDPSFENTFKRLHLNIITEQAFRWMQLDKWDLCSEAFDPGMLRGLPCWAGLDLATVIDMAALVLCFPVDDEFFLLPFCWCPRESAEQRERKDRQPYITWARQGHLALTEGNTIDDRAIRKQINELGSEYSIQEIAFDPWNATTLARQLGEEDGFHMVEFRQGTISMNEPMKTLMRLVLDVKLRHGGHPVLRWCASNLSARNDPSDNIRPDRAASKEKIDAMVAAIMAVGRATARNEVGSVYDDPDYELVRL